MPELPEVETVCRGLRKHIIGRTITSVVVRSDSVIHQDILAEAFRARLQGAKIFDVKRRGKYIAIVLDKGALICHLRMTGKLLVRKADRVPEKHDHVIFYLDSETALFYEDVRRFGGFFLCESGEATDYEPLSKLGPEPLTEAFSAQYFFQSTRKRKRPIKSHLLDQGVVAGIGNIYADEILFCAGIRPRKSAMRLTRAEAQAVVVATKGILDEAIAAGGSTIRDYVDSENREGAFQLSHQVYGRAGAPCKRCGTPLKSVIVGGRSSVYCPNCQKS